MAEPNKLLDISAPFVKLCLRIAYLLPAHLPVTLLLSHDLMCCAAGFEFLNTIVIVIRAKLSTLSQNQT